MNEALTDESSLLDGYNDLLKKAEADKEYVIANKDKLSADIYKGVLESAEADIALAKRKILGLSIPQIPATEIKPEIGTNHSDSGLIDAAALITYAVGGFLLYRWAKKDPVNRMPVVNAYFNKSTTPPALPPRLPSIPKSSKSAPFFMVEKA